MDERQPGAGAGAVAEGAKEKRGLMFLCAIPSLLWCAARRLVQAHGRTDPLIQKSSCKLACSLFVRGERLLRLGYDMGGAIHIHE